LPPGISSAKRFSVGSRKIHRLLITILPLDPESHPPGSVSPKYITIPALAHPIPEAG